MPHTPTFGSWVRERRQAFDLTQTQLGNLVGCSASAIHKIETGRRRPSRQIAELLAEHLSVPAQEYEAFVQWGRGLSDIAPQLTIEIKPSAPARPPAIRPPAPLPVPPTPFIGRVEQAGAVRAALWRAATRLVTLTGPPGIGRTRIALEVAASLRDDFTDGVRFVNLAPVTNSALVAQAIAGALQVHPAADQPLISALKEYLWDKQMLLVLDNFEQLLPAAGVVAELMSAAPQVKILATSRAALRIRGEKQLAVPPLDLPDVRQLAGPDEIGRVEGIALFLERAQDVLSDFALTAENAADIAAICIKLEGLPLAIELAAAQVKSLPLQTLLSRLDQRLALLEDAYTDLPPHQQTLRAAIAWSYNLLEPRTQQVFRKLGVFVGGCTLEAATAVCADRGAGEEVKAEHGVRAALSNLVNHSLVQPGGGGESEARFLMLETIREFALEQLAGPGSSNDVEGHATRRAYTDYYLQLVERANQALVGPEHIRWLDRLEREQDNLRAALGWTIEQGRAEEAQRLATALHPLWRERGDRSEGRGWLDASLPLGPTPPAVRARALSLASHLAFEQGDYIPARAYSEEGLHLAREAGDRQEIIRILRRLGTLANYRDDLAMSHDLLEESLALAQEAGDLAGVGYAYQALGNLASRQRNYQEARRCYELGLEASRGLNDPMFVAAALLKSRHVDAIAR